MFKLPAVQRGLNPFERISIFALGSFADSAEDELAYKPSSLTLFGLLAVSAIVQGSPAALVSFISRYRGRILVNTNGPSVEPLPVNDPKAE